MTKVQKKKKGIFKYLVIVLAIIACMGFLIPTIFGNLKFGLDLQGGFEVLYQVKSLDDGKVTSDMMNNTYKALLKRIDILGVNEPVITIEGEDKIRVQLAGVTNQDEARKILSSAATLTFRDSEDNLLMTSDVLASGGASLGQDQKGRPAVALAIKDKDEFYKVTKKVSQMKNNLIVIWLDFEDGVDNYESSQKLCGSSNSRCLSAATVSEGFSSDVIIQGSFTTDEVTTLVDLINSGSLPTKLEELSSKTVAASFGEDSLQKTAIAGIIGFVIVIGLMIVLYRFAGFISAVGLLVYTVLTFGIFWLVGGVLTLPGIAAIVLGIGMAVDVNVINFARIKDEMLNGSSFENAFVKGNKNSISTIIDANLTTFIVAIILFIFGESSVKGFATMLIISIFTTMIVMFLLTRFLLKLFVKTHAFDEKPTVFLGKIKPRRKDYNFVAHKNKFLIVSLILIIIGVGSLFINGLNLGVDFKGGTSINIKSEEKLDIKKISDEIENLGYKISDTEVISDNSVYVKVADQLEQQQILDMQNKFATDYQASTDIDVVSTMVRDELIKNAIISIILASIAIILYISFRFKFNYAIGAIFALLHDVFLIFTVFSLLKLEVSTIFIAALLSIIGYSINDTIVIFDRIRENMHKKDVKTKEDLANVVNLSLNQTIKRSIITSITTIVTVLALIIFGSNEILNFNIALIIGLFAGTYSSLFIASMLWYMMEKRSVGKPKKKKWYEESEPTEKKIKGINA